MLVLSRYDNQKIMIGTEEDFKNSTYITVSVRQDRAKTKVSIDAPKDTVVLREELVEDYQGRLCQTV
jgi:sRNA-binding carbon storage regulator CsrA